MSAGQASRDTGRQSRRRAACDVASQRACPAAMSDAASNRTRRNAAVVVTDPRIVVVESSTAADPAALDDALELLVRWAVRAHARKHRVEAKAQTAEAEASSAQSEGPIAEAVPPAGQPHVPDATRAQAPDAQGDAPSDKDSITYRPGEMT